MHKKVALAVSGGIDSAISAFKLKKLGLEVIGINFKFWKWENNSPESPTLNIALLEDIGKIDLTGIHWVIVGGESGANARPMIKEWVLNVKKQCEEQNVAFFFKQWGAWGADGVRRSKKSNGRILEGKEWNQYPLMAI